MTIRAQPVVDMRGDLDPNSFLLEAVLAEAGTTATSEQEHGFLLAVGKRIAGIFPLVNTIELAALEGLMNDVWQLLDLGRVQLVIDENGIGIEHRRSPGRAFVAGARWSHAEPVILEGAYAHWFSMVGNESLSLKRVDRVNDIVKFHYGR